MLLGAGVDLLGFPLALDFHREDIPASEAARIVKTLELMDRAVLITYLTRSRDIAVLLREIQVRTVQLHGPVTSGTIEDLRRRVPGLSVIKSLIVSGDNLEELKGQCRTLEHLVDGFITDTFDPETGACGATGRTHDWTVSRALREVSRKPLILAGGLTPENVYDAVLRVGPFGVDAHTGVESGEGRKDPSRVEAFVRTARKAFRLMSERVSVPLGSLGTAPDRRSF